MSAVLARHNARVVGTSARTMMLAHGFGCDQNMWRFIVPVFSDDYRLLLFDDMGAGHSDMAHEVFQRPESMALWTEAGQGRAQWDLIFAEYRSAVDYPSGAYWRELAAHYPDAKVIHTTRDPETWFESTQATIFAPDGLAVQAIASGEGPASAFFRSFARH